MLTKIAIIRLFAKKIGITLNFFNMSNLLDLR